jgi:hypothetical protein
MRGCPSFETPLSRLLQGTVWNGAVSGLRNPRAHGFIKDDPERALEFMRE